MERRVFAGPAVRKVRREAGMTQAAMAEALAISPSYLNLIENGQRPLSATVISTASWLVTRDVEI